MQAGAV